MIDQTYSVVLSLDDLISFCGLGGHLQSAGSARLQLLHLTHMDTAGSENKTLFPSVKDLAKV